MSLDRLSREICNRAPATCGLMTQFRVEIVREFHRGALHGMPAYPLPITHVNAIGRSAVGEVSGGVLVPRDGIEPPTRGFSVLTVVSKNQ